MLDNLEIIENYAVAILDEISTLRVKIQKNTPTVAAAGVNTSESEVNQCLKKSIQH